MALYEDRKDLILPAIGEENTQFRQHRCRDEIPCSLSLAPSLRARNRLSPSSSCGSLLMYTAVGSKRSANRTKPRSLSYSSTLRGSYHNSSLLYSFPSETAGFDQFPLDYSDVDVCGENMHCSERNCECKIHAQEEKKRRRYSFSDGLQDLADGSTATDHSDSHEGERFQRYSQSLLHPKIEIELKTMRAVSSVDDDNQENQASPSLNFSAAGLKYGSDTRNSTCGASETSVPDVDSIPSDDEVHKLENLHLLFQQGFITNTEFKERRSQLVSEITSNSQGGKSGQMSSVSSRPVPDFTKLKKQKGIKHTFNYHQRKWATTPIFVKMDLLPFANGGLRRVYHLQDLSLGTTECAKLVAKIAINSNEDPDTYFRDVEMQAVAANYATLYNSYNPPRKIEFITAWILQLVPNSTSSSTADSKMASVLCGVEPYIEGEYHKHNNNCGFVSELERNTPQAFSHFTYEASNQELLVVDIQGVGDHYTDPQIHTKSGVEFGKGNLAHRGFEKFLSTHRCNPICRYLRLPLINPKKMSDDDGSFSVKGTVPSQPYMTKARVDPVVSELRHYYGSSNGYQQHVRGQLTNADNSSQCAESSISLSHTEKDGENSSDETPSSRRGGPFGSGLSLMDGYRRSLELFRNRRPQPASQSIQSLLGSGNGNGIGNNGREVKATCGTGTRCTALQSDEMYHYMTPQHVRTWCGVETCSIQ